MDNKKRISIEGVFERSDKGGKHRRWRHSGYAVLMYNFNGELEARYSDVDEAVEKNTVGATYTGIVNCVTGKVKKHAGKIWRKEAAV